VTTSPHRSRPDDNFERRRQSGRAEQGPIQNETRELSGYWGYGGSVRASLDEFTIADDTAIVGDPGAELERPRGRQRLLDHLRPDEVRTLLDDALLLAERAMKAAV